MEAIKSISGPNNNHFLIKGIFQLLIIGLIAIPTYINLQSINTVNWTNFLLLILFQYLLTQLYFLFSKQKALTLVKNMIVLLVFEVVLIGLILFGPFTILAKALLFLQWLLIHLVIGTQNLLPILPPLFIAMEMVIMQNILEMANANVLITGLGITSFLFYLATFSWLSSLFVERQSIGVEIAGQRSNTQRILRLLGMFAVIVLIIAIALSFMTSLMVTSQAITATIITVVLCFYATFLKHKI